MDKNAIIDLMKQRGFIYTLETRDGKGNPMTYCFRSEPEYHRHRKDVIVMPSFSCTVYPDSNEFDFTYIVPHSINKLNVPKCSPFTDEDQFNRICVKFESAVRALYQAFPEE